MATFEAAYHERAKCLKEEVQKGKDVKARVLVDPMISVDQIQTALESLVKHKKDSDLYRHIGAPSSCVAVNWQTPPHGEWMLKCCGLVWDLLSFCPNTKLSSSKVRKALQQMATNHSLSVPSYLGKLKDAIDRIDLSIRLVMNMYREVASKPLLKTRLLRSMSRENCLKFEMVLQKVHIPMDGMGLDSQESEESVGQSLSCVLETPTPCRALVPQPTVLEKEAVPEHQEARFPFKRVSVSHCSSVALEPTPSIFQRILQGTSAGSLKEFPEGMNASPPVPQADEADLLKAAQQYAPPQTNQRNKSKVASSGEGQEKNKSPSKKRFASQRQRLRPSPKL